MFNSENKFISPEEYINSLEEPRKSEIKKLHELILKVLPKQKPLMMSGMLAYGKYHYKYKSGREGDWALILLSSRKNYISLYVCSARDGKYLTEFYKEKLSKTNIGKSCIRIKKLDDVDLNVIKEMLIDAEKTGAFSAV